MPLHINLLQNYPILPQYFPVWESLAPLSFQSLANTPGFAISLWNVSRPCWMPSIPQQIQHMVPFQPAQHKVQSSCYEHQHPTAPHQHLLTYRKVYARIEGENHEKPNTHKVAVMMYNCLLMYNPLFFLRILYIWKYVYQIWGFHIYTCIYLYVCIFRYL